ncbi:MAG: hypothetical protein ACK421_11345, partial [Pseudanabaenaceae cyanobacterium]
YDYYGFPDEAYAPHTTYPVKTDLAVADRVIAQIEAASHGKWRVAKKERGFDHGVFIPLKVAFPEANIPVVQLSLKEGLSMREHIQLGEYLRPLRSEGVLIVTSGQITHNLRMMRSGDPNVKDPKSVEFCEYICRLLESTTPENYEEHKRRLVNAELVNTLAQIVVPGGMVLVQSDVWDTAYSILRQFEAHPRFINRAGAGQFATSYPEHIPTERELWAMRKERPIYRLVFQLSG